MTFKFSEIKSGQNSLIVKQWIGPDGVTGTPEVIASASFAQEAKRIVDALNAAEEDKAAPKSTEEHTEAPVDTSERHTHLHFHPNGHFEHIHEHGHVTHHVHDH